MIRQLIAVMCMVLMLSAGTAGASGDPIAGDGVFPPTLIDTDDLYLAEEGPRMAGYDIYMKYQPGPKIIAARRDVQLHETISDKSPVVGTLKADEEAVIVSFKAFLYPRWGKATVTGPIKFADTPMGHRYEDQLASRGLLPQIGDTIYVIFAYPGTKNEAAVWYKGQLILLPGDGIKAQYLKDSSYTYAVYEGYTNPGDDGTFRRNADVWLKVQLTDKTQGWVQINEGLKGAAEQDRWWYPAPSSSMKDGVLDEYAF